MWRRSRSASPLSRLKLNGSLVEFVNDVSETSEIACPQVYATWNARRLLKRRLSHNCNRVIARVTVRLVCGDVADASQHAVIGDQRTLVLDANTGTGLATFNPARAICSLAESLLPSHAAAARLVVGGMSLRFTLRRQMCRP